MLHPEGARVRVVQQGDAFRLEIEGKRIPGVVSHQVSSAGPHAIDTITLVLELRAYEERREPEPKPEPEPRKKAGRATRAKPRRRKVVGRR